MSKRGVKEMRIKVKGYYEMTFYPPDGKYLRWRHKRLDDVGWGECTEVENMLLDRVTHLEGVERAAKGVMETLHDPMGGREEINFNDLAAALSELEGES